MSDTPSATAAKAIAGALLRHAITFAGSALVARGYLDQETADSATGAIADYLIGAGLTIGAAGWSVFRAWLMHLRWVQAWIAPARPMPPATSPTAA